MIHCLVFKQGFFCFQTRLLLLSNKDSLCCKQDFFEKDASAGLNTMRNVLVLRHKKGNRIVRQIVMIFQVNAVVVYVVVGCRSSLFDDSKFLAYLDESSDCLVKLLLCVGGRELYADASLALRHNGIVETGDINALFKQTVGITL